MSRQNYFLKYFFILVYFIPGIYFAQVANDENLYSVVTLENEIGKIASVKGVTVTMIIHKQGGVKTNDRVYIKNNNNITTVLIQYAMHSNAKGVVAEGDIRNLSANLVVYDRKKETIREKIPEQEIDWTRSMGYVDDVNEKNASFVLHQEDLINTDDFLYGKSGDDHFSIKIQSIDSKNGNGKLKRLLVIPNGTRLYAKKDIWAREKTRKKEEEQPGFREKLAEQTSSIFFGPSVVYMLRMRLPKQTSSEMPNFFFVGAHYGINYNDFFGVYGNAMYGKNMSSFKDTNAYYRVPNLAGMLLLGTTSAAIRFWVSLITGKFTFPLIEWISSGIKIHLGKNEVALEIFGALNQTYVQKFNSRLYLDYECGISIVNRARYSGFGTEFGVKFMYTSVWDVYKYIGAGMHFAFLF